MALLEKFLVVKKSTLPGAGKGLFTRKFIPKGARIIEYKGRKTTWKEVEHDHDNAYLFTVHPELVIDAKRALKSLARYANDARGFTRVKGVTNNCIYFRDENDRIFVEAKRDIPAGSEIFVSYGDEYWKVMKENRRIEQEAEKERLAEQKSANKKSGAKKAAAKKGKVAAKSKFAAKGKAAAKSKTATKTKAAVKTKTATKAKAIAKGKTAQKKTAAKKAKK